MSLSSSRLISPRPPSAAVSNPGPKKRSLRPHSAVQRQLLAAGDLDRPQRGQVGCVFGMTRPWDPGKSSTDERAGTPCSPRSSRHHAGLAPWTPRLPPRARTPASPVPSPSPSLHPRPWPGRPQVAELRQGRPDDPWANHDVIPIPATGSDPSRPARGSGVDSREGANGPSHDPQAPCVPSAPRSSPTRTAWPWA